jgi:hypothetical protein
LLSDNNLTVQNATNQIMDIICTYYFIFSELYSSSFAKWFNCA